MNAWIDLFAIVIRMAIGYVLIKKARTYEMVQGFGRGTRGKHASMCMFVHLCTTVLDYLRFPMFFELQNACYAVVERFVHGFKLCSAAKAVLPCAPK